ncbi:hypothetical protein [Mycobacterium kyorinense]|nr:hypothetical protein [Mycobacterium kyorinense]
MTSADSCDALVVGAGFSGLYAYTGGIPEYRCRCDEIAAGGYTGCKLA